MAKDPAFMFYSSDFLVGTMTMSFEDKGKYITILSYMHQNGRISEETIRLLVGSVSDMLRLKFSQDKDGNWFNNRLESEIEKRKNFVSSRQENGKKGGRPPKIKEKSIKKTYAKPKQNLPEDDNINDNINKYSFINISGFEKIFERWIDYKKARKEKYKSDDSLKSAYNKLVKLSEGNPENAHEIIDEAISNNWAGFFALKINPIKTQDKFEKLGKAYQSIENPFKKPNDEELKIN